MKMKVRRAMLVRCVQEWDIDSADIKNLKEDTPEFDEAVCALGDLVYEEIRFDVDDDELETTYDEVVRGYGVQTWPLIERENNNG